MTSAIIDDWHGTVRFRFNQPRHRNALDLVVVRELAATLSGDPAATVVLGSTDPTIFCAGADLNSDDATRQKISLALYDCYHLMISRPGVVIAVIEGAAVGGGAQLATACDLRLAGPAARWRWVGPAHGLAIGSWILPALVGRGRALELMLTSRWVDATEAARIGLATGPSEDPWAEADLLARHLAGLEAKALAAIKHVTLNAGVTGALRAEGESNRGWSGYVPVHSAEAGPAAQ